MSEPGSGPSRAPVAHASLTVGTVETHYRRAGSGPPVLLLGLGQPSEAEMIDRLAASRGRRVIVPDGTSVAALAPAPTEGESTFVRWLHDFLQGLGLERPAVVAASAFRDELERYRRVHPEELGPAVIVGPEGTSSEGVADLLRAEGRPEL